MDFYDKDYVNKASPDFLINPSKIYMHYLFDYDPDTGNAREVSILPKEGRDSDRLNMFSKKLMLRNPAIDFTHMVKQGLLDDLTDDDYSDALNRIKAISKLYDNKEYMNIFEYLALITRFALSGKLSSKSSETGAMSVQRFLDNNKIYSEERSMVYSFLSGRGGIANLYDPEAYAGVSLPESPVMYYIPKDDWTLYIFSKEKVIILTLYDPNHSWLAGDTEDDIVDLESLMSDIGIDVDGAEEEFLRNTLLLQKTGLLTPEVFFGMLAGRKIELYSYHSSSDYEAVYPEGELEPLRLERTSDGRAAILFKRIYEPKGE